MGEITIQKALDDYKTIYMPYRNFAEQTREEYWNDISDFVGFLEKAGRHHIKAVGLPNIKTWQVSAEP